MSLLTRNTETTGHDLAVEAENARRDFEAKIASLQSQAEDRASVVESRLQELEAEKFVLNGLAAPIGVVTVR